MLQDHHIHLYLFVYFRRIVSQCNSRDTSTNRATSPRDNDGFRVPSAAAKSMSINQV